MGSIIFYLTHIYLLYILASLFHWLILKHFVTGMFFSIPLLDTVSVFDTIVQN